MASAEGLSISDILGKSIAVEVSDGRVIEGELLCLDKNFHFVLSEAVEHHPKGANHNMDFTGFNSRPLGLAVIRGEHVVRCMMKVSESR